MAKELRSEIAAAEQRQKESTEAVPKKVDTSFQNLMECMATQFQELKTQPPQFQRRQPPQPRQAPSNGACHKCGEQGHWAKDCTSESRRIPPGNQSQQFQNRSHQRQPLLTQHQAFRSANALQQVMPDPSCYNCGSSEHCAYYCDQPLHHHTHRNIVAYLDGEPTQLNEATVTEQWGSDQAAHQHACQGVANQVIGICAQNNDKWVGRPDSALSAKTRKQRLEWEA